MCHSGGDVDTATGYAYVGLGSVCKISQFCYYPKLL